MPRLYPVSGRGPFPRGGEIGMCEHVLAPAMPPPPPLAIPLMDTLLSVLQCGDLYRFCVSSRTSFNCPASSRPLQAPILPLHFVHPSCQGFDCWVVHRLVPLCSFKQRRMRLVLSARTPRSGMILAHLRCGGNSCLPTLMSVVTHASWPIYPFSVLLQARGRPWQR